MSSCVSQGRYDQVVERNPQDPLITRSGEKEDRFDFLTLRYFTNSNNIHVIHLYLQTFAIKPNP